MQLQEENQKLSQQVHDLSDALTTLAASKTDKKVTYVLLAMTLISLLSTVFVAVAPMFS